MSDQITVNRPELSALTAWHTAIDLSIQAGELSRASGETYKRGLARFMAWAQASRLELVTSDSIRRWIAEMRAQGHKPTSINTWLAGVRRFFSWAQETGLILGNPAISVKTVKRNGTNKRHLRDALTDHELLRVLSMPDLSSPSGKRDLAWLSLMAFCALRTIEINRADLGDLSTVNGLPVLRVQGKGSLEKDDIAVIASARAQTALYDWLAVRGDRPGALFVSMSDRNNGERLGLSAIRHLGGVYFGKAGIVDSRKTLHSLRHSAISKVAKHDVLKARQVARHVSIDTTMIYIHESDRLENPGEQWIEYKNGESET